jgi:uncharacterized membrane protein YgcG
VVQRLEHSVVHALDEPTVRTSLAELAQVHNWLTATRAAFVVRLDELTAAPREPAAENGEACRGEGGGDGAAGGPSRGACPKPTELELADAARTTEREAARLAMLARLLARFPEFARALRASVVADSHLQVLGRLWHQLDLADRDRLVSLDTRLVTMAGYADPERVRRLVAAEINRLRTDDGVARLTKQRQMTGLTHWVDDSGMVNLRAQFDPERGQRLLGRIRQRRDQLLASGDDPVDCPATGPARWQHLDAVALFDLTDRAAVGADGGAGGGGGGGGGADGWAGGGGGGGGRGSMFGVSDTEVVVVIDEVTLRDRVHAATHLDTGEVTLPPETLRRLACNAGVIPVVLGGDGVVLDVGRVRRLATHAQRVALRAMYATCSVPGCGVGFEWCQPHHLRPWQSPTDGPTDLANLAPLCSRHHHAAHEGGWMLHLDPVDRRLTVIRPDGSVLIGYPDRRRQTDATADRSNAFDTNLGQPDSDNGEARGTSDGAGSSEARGDVNSDVNGDGTGDANPQAAA